MEHHHHTGCSPTPIGLYRDVWIAAIASSRTRLATLSGVMCNTSQCELRSLRVNSGMLNVIRIVANYALPRIVANLVLDCNGVFTIKAYRVSCGSIGTKRTKLVNKEQFIDRN